MNKAISNPPMLVESSRRPRGVDRANIVDRMRGHDKNNDGKITKAEFEGPAQIFTRFDRNKDGVVDNTELESAAQNRAVNRQ